MVTLWENVEAGERSIGYCPSLGVGNVSAFVLGEIFSQKYEAGHPWEAGRACSQLHSTGDGNEILCTDVGKAPSGTPCCTNRVAKLVEQNVLRFLT